MEKDLKSKTIDQLCEVVESLGGKKYLAKYIFNFIHEKNVEDINSITTLSKSVRSALQADSWCISKAEILQKFEDPDGTVKYLFQFADGQKVEAVLLVDGKRKTVCISTQAGCAMGCVFCATAKIKFARNLTAGEIVDQVYCVEKDAGKINNVVYMGMGEPFLNYDAVMDSVGILNSDQGRNIGIRHITVSTCGMPDEIEKFTYQDLQPRLAVSLHAASDSVREKLMPINKKYPLKELMKSLDAYQGRTRNRVTFEYIMIKGVNDSVKESESLIKLLKSRKCNVNLIEYNPHSGCSYKPSSHNAIKRFAKDLNDAGIETVIRYKRGQEIKAACGQLGADWLV